MKKIAVSGASGLIGSRVIDLLKKEFQFIPLSQEEFDITDSQSVHNTLFNLDFDLFLHLAGYTNVDGAEIEREKAQAINVEGTRNVFEHTKVKGKEFIYISTDFVFDGQSNSYNETSTPHPQGVYATTKYQGEEIVKEDAMIVRIAYPYRAAFDKKTDFVRSIKSLLADKKEIKAVADSSITPTFVDDIAYALQHLMNNFSKGIYHVVGASSHSPYDAFVKIAKTFDLDETLIQKTTAEEFFKGKAPRPQCGTIVSNTNNFYPMSSFDDGLAKMKSQIK